MSTYSYGISFPTRLLFGEGQFTRIGIEAAKLGQNAFVMIDPFLKGSPVEAALDQSLKTAKIAATKWYDIVPNPRAKTCDKAAALAKEQASDFIIAVGGGSTIDAAKAVALVVVHGENSWDYTARAGTDFLQPTTPGLPLIAVSTAAGTGAEVTPFAVLSNQERKLKATIINEVCYPSVAIVDPSLHVSKPAPLTASTGVDTFLHAFEGYIGKNANGWSDTFSLRAIELFAQNIRTACAEPQNMAARTKMAESCYLAGITLASIGVGIPHALGQALGALKDTPHGASCAACAVPTIRWTLPDASERMARVATMFDTNLVGMDTKAQAEKLPDLLTKLFVDIGLDASFGSLGLTMGEADKLVDVAFTNYGQDINCSIKDADRDAIMNIVKNSL